MKNIFFLLCLVCFSLTKTFSQFTWEHTDGPFGALAPFLFSNADYAFIPENDFLYRSADGSSWEKLMDVREIPSGIYFLQVREGEYHDIMKVVKQ